MPERIVFMDCTLSSLITAHKILDTNEDVEIDLITTAFEVGMYGENPGLLPPNPWPFLRPHWLSEAGFDQPGDGDTAVKSSWLRKAIAISLAKRGARIHTGVRRNKVLPEEGRVLLSYPGERTELSIGYDKIVPTRETEGPLWRGAVVTKPPEWATYAGLRPDGTYEIWWSSEEDPRSPLQLMEWQGPNPSNELSRQMSLSETKLTNLNIGQHRT